MYAKQHIFADRSIKSLRSVRSTERIQAVFVELLKKTPYLQISIVDVADASGLARSTVYRRWAGREALLWNLIRPAIEMALDRALAGDVGAAGRALSALWDTPPAIAALHHPATARLVRDNVATLFAAAVARRTPNRDAQTCALLIASSIMAFLVDHAGASPPDRDKLAELVYIVYVSAHMTPRALEASAQQRVRNGWEGRFPPAVSVTESLASDDYIVSMIDGRPYRSLTKHIARFGFDAEHYKRCFGLAADYPMVARTYSERRSALARSIFRNREAIDHDRTQVADA